MYITPKGERTLHGLAGSFTSLPLPIFLFFRLGIVGGSPPASGSVGARFGLAFTLPLALIMPLGISSGISTPAPISDQQPTRSPSLAPNARSSLKSVDAPSASRGNAAMRCSSRTSQVAHGRLESGESDRRQRAFNAERQGASESQKWKVGGGVVGDEIGIGAGAGPKAWAEGGRTGAIVGDCGVGEGAGEGG